jgi:hypothetical protein
MKPGWQKCPKGFYREVEKKPLLRPYLCRDCQYEMHCFDGKTMVIKSMEIGEIEKIGRVFQEIPGEEFRIGLFYRMKKGYKKGGEVLSTLWGKKMLIENGVVENAVAIARNLLKQCVTEGLV